MVKQVENLLEEKEILFEHLTNNLSLDFTTDIGHIIQKKNILIYRFSDDMCENCVYEDLSNLRQLQKEIGKDKILLLPAYKNDRKSQIRLSNEVKGFQYQNISEEVITFPIIKQLDIKSRYMAYIDSIGSTEMFFIPIKGEKELTQRYFSKIKEDFLQNQYAIYK